MFVGKFLGRRLRLRLCVGTPHLSEALTSFWIARSRAISAAFNRIVASMTPRGLLIFNACVALLQILTGGSPFILARVTNPPVVAIDGYLLLRFHMGLSCLGFPGYRAYIQYPPEGTHP